MERRLAEKEFSEKSFGKTRLKETNSDGNNMQNQTRGQQLIATVLLMGKSLIASGSELKRAEDTMNRLIQNDPQLTPDEKEKTYVYVTINSIFLRCGAEVVDFVTIYERNFNLAKISQLNQLSREFAVGKITVLDLYARIEAVMAKNVSRRFLWLANCLLSLSITVILGGTILECLVAALVGLATSQTFWALKRVMSNNFLCQAAATFVGGAVGMAYCIMTKGDPTLLYIAAIIPLVPGINLTNGVHDTFDSYYISGPVMILESLTTLVCLSLGVTLLQLLPFGVIASGKIAVIGVPVVLQLLGGAACSLSFAYMIDAPRRLFLPIGLAGAATWWMYVFVTAHTTGALFNNLLSIALLSLLSRLFARHWKEPMTMFFIPALVAVVPGITLFVGLNQWILGESSVAAVTVSNVVISLLGLAIGSLLGDELFGLGNRLLSRHKK